LNVVLLPHKVKKLKHIHFIAIGGAAMHNMALALHKNGFRITGSDDEIKEPSLTRLKIAGLLPESIGWFPEKIEARPDLIILGMHARADNPELIKAQELGLPVMSFPEYLYEHSKNKTRVVIGGSHGKTSITSMVMHALRECGIDFDYMVGSTVAGFDTMVRLTDEAPYIILEGDEYLSSPVDRRPKFHLYCADIALVSGIAWDHINVFPTFENYVDQFRIFINNIPETGTLVWFGGDQELASITESVADKIELIKYDVPQHEIVDGSTIVEFNGSNYQLEVFGRHNLANLEGARQICLKLGIGGDAFYKAMTFFKGAGRRLEKVAETKEQIVFRDFAHSPSKLKATVGAVKEQFPNRKIIACFELHTFSSLSDSFLEQYSNTMEAADVALVYFNPDVIAHKKIKPISAERVQDSFGMSNLDVLTDPKELSSRISMHFQGKSVLLLMSSGSFDGLKMDQFIQMK
jgi:UDP-N-acetylmuramate: L-alanyl-gamma-D-glutamyl-meso-diaminopimelate ligase